MTRYSRGADFERKVKADLQANGWFVVRSAGSHGPVDLIAQAPGPSIAWIQCKRDGKMSGRDQTDIINLAKAFDAIPILAYKDNGVCYSELFADRKMDWTPGEAA